MSNVQRSTGHGPDAIVFTGYYHRAENANYLEEIGVPVPYDTPERRKVLPKELDDKVVRLYQAENIATPLFRKTSCGASYAFGVADYNGHWGVQDICDICPIAQRARCAKRHRSPSNEEFESLLAKLDYDTDYFVEGGHAWTSGLGEERRYHLQHLLGFQIWDVDLPHFPRRHGRANLGYLEDPLLSEWHRQIRREMAHDVVYDDG